MAGTTATDRFTVLIGTIIHNCGGLELVTNNAINKLGTDSILAQEIATLTFERRIKILRKLLHARTSLPDEEVDSLCDELSRIAKERNDVAHNPVVSDGEHGPTAHILVVRGNPASSPVKKVTEADLNKLATRAHKAFDKFVNLVFPTTPTKG